MTKSNRWLARFFAALAAAGLLLRGGASAVRATDCNQDGIDDSLQLVTCGPAFSAERSYAPGGFVIPDFNFTGISSTITVTDVVQVCKLRVHLNIMHSRPGQLVLRLRHENTATQIVIIELMGNPTPHGCVGECGTGLDVVLDDSASQSIEFEWHTECISIVHQGTYTPYPQMLTLFNGETSAGDWTLKVFDVKSDNTGSLMSWSLDFYGQVDNDCNDNGVPDECDIDPDWDGTPDFDCNGNGIFDGCEADGDTDGVINACDNCPTTPNPDQTNSDPDSLGDACDNCPLVANEDQANADADSAGDACDDCPNDPNKIVPGQCGCGVADTDTDNDGLADCVDPCPARKAGDVSGNGLVDWGDVSPFVAVLLDPAGATPDDRCAADMDGSGTPDGADIQGFVTALLPGP